MTSEALLLVLNCGSSSIKYALYDASDPPPRSAAWRGKVELDARSSHEALKQIRAQVNERLGNRRLAAVGHRVVHGGSKYSQPTRVDAAVLEDLKRYIPLAPLHQPFALEAIEMLLAESPELPQVACFDTAFHASLPRVEQLLPLPHAYGERGLRRYGFHGLSYAYMALALPERHGDAARGRVIVAHLGGGASLCAMKDLKSVATPLGFSALDGLMMGTRCGSLDPGALLYLMEIEKLTPERIGHLLYNESGLLGVSGVSSDPRVLLDREGADQRARDALALYVHRIVREIGALTAILGGLDLLVFTAGVGEHNAEIRRRVCERLGFLWLTPDQAANARHAPLISAAGSAVKVGVAPTNEEWIVAGQSIACVRKKAGQA